MKIANNELNCTALLSGHGDSDCVSKLSQKDVNLALILSTALGIPGALAAITTVVGVIVKAIRKWTGMHT